MDAVEDIKQRVSIEDVVGEYVELKRAGRNWKGLSPFSSERTPSFMVSPEKQIWHDFSSGKGGNMFSFVMEMEGVDFKGALELLARKAGLDLSQYRHAGSGEAARQKERLYDLLELAAKFYQTQLKHNQAALAYVLTKRAFSKETVLAWRLGYSPNNGTALVDFAKSKGFNEQHLKGAGLSARGYRGVADMFRGRIMIPLADAQGRIIGFTARLLADDPNAPKYINTPQTILYDKSRHVFGLHLAKDAIRKQGYAVIAEGNLDVISSHQAGVQQVVATAGTALTEAHLKTLGRFTNDIRLSFDADKAGINATERAIPIASKVDVDLSIITIPHGKDPDELIRHDLSAWQSAVAHPHYALDWLIERHKSRLDLSSAQGKRAFSDILLAVIRGLSDPVEQEHYLDTVAGLIGVSREVLQAKLRQKSFAPQGVARKKVRQQFDLPPKEVLEYTKTQNHLLAVALMQPTLRSLLASLPDDIALDPSARSLLGFLQTHPDFAGDPTEVPQLLPIVDYVKIMILRYEELYQNVDIRELEYEAVQVRAKLIGQYVKMQKQRIALALQSADNEAQTSLLEQAKELDNLLKVYKGGA